MHEQDQSQQVLVRLLHWLANFEVLDPDEVLAEHDNGQFQHIININRTWRMARQIPPGLYCEAPCLDQSVDTRIQELIYDHYEPHHEV